MARAQVAGSRTAEPSYCRRQAEESQRSDHSGARGFKVLKTPRLYRRDIITTVKRCAADDPRFDAMWEAAGALGMLAGTSTVDPAAIVRSVDVYNEPIEELQVC